MKFYLAILFSLLSVALHATIIIATSTSYSDVSNAVYLASGGDTVIVPSGSATWPAQLGFRGKSLNLIGGGGTNGTTVITDNTPSSSSLIHFSADPPNFVRLSGFTLQQSVGHDGNNGLIHIDGTIRYFGFRIDHMTLIASNASADHLLLPYQDYGLIDHCHFIVNASSGSVQSISVLGTVAGEDSGFPPWMYYGTNGFALGDTNAVFIEDCSFYYNPSDAGVEDSIDAYSAARLVIRHNTFTNQSVGFHGLDSGLSRSIISFEIYSNSFINNSSTTYHSGNTRGGTGVIFGNTYGGSHNIWDDFSLLLYRAVPNLVYSDWGHCDGTQWLLEDTGFSSDGIHTCATYPTGTIGFNTNNNETIGTYSVGGLYSRYLDGGGNCGYPGRDQPGIAPGQKSFPIWCWDNGGVNVTEYNNSGGLTFCGGDSSLTNWLMAGRDYTNSVLAKPGYIPFTYPHPLQSIILVTNINAANLNFLTVQIAVNSIIPETEVNLPSGSVTWSNTLIISNSITLHGNGTALTFLTNAVGTMIKWFPTNNGTIRITGITFVNQDTNAGVVQIYGPVYGMQIDHCNFIKGNTPLLFNQYGFSSDIASGEIYGVVSQCKFTNCASPIFVCDAVSSDLGSNGITQWHNGLIHYADHFNNTNNIYFENNNFIWDGGYTSTVTNSAAIFGYGGGWRTIRYNNFIGESQYIDTYGDDPINGSCSVCYLDVYSNSFSFGTSVLQDPIAFAKVRGGNGDFWGNTFHGYNGTKSFELFQPNPTDIYTITNYDVFNGSDVSVLITNVPSCPTCSTNNIILGIDYYTNFDHIPIPLYYVPHPLILVPEGWIWTYPVNL